MKVNIQNSKSILAKLLAAENITVSHQQTKTAYFDLKTRTLVCPVWKDMDGALYDLLMGHEVGHALNTPQAGWHSAIHDDNGKLLGKFKDFLNVIEDARIEKQVKRKFPGLAKSFAEAYKDLHERDFFGIKNVDANKLNLIDRINLRYKLGAHLPVAFNDDERAFLVDIDNAETWEQVVDVARRVYAYCKQQKEEQKSQINNMNDLKEEMQQQRQQEQSEFEDFNDDSDEDADDSDDSDDSDLDEESDGSESEDGEDSDEDSDESENDSQNNATGEQDDSDDSDASDDEPESVTDRNFRQREQELINESGQIHMIELPEANLSKIILQNNIVMNDLEKWMRDQVADPNRPYGRNGISYETVAAKCVRKFNANNKKFIMHILKEFEMRKKAADYARVQTAKTGELNMSALHNYKFTNDLFKKISVVPKGKNHGMIMYVDMSGSMCDILRNTIEQCLVLVSFCRLAKIPFDVYGFSNDYYQSSGPQVSNHGKFVQSPTNEGGIGRIDECNFHLKHLIGSTLSPIDYRRSFNNLCIVANEYYRGYHNSVGTKDDNDYGSFYYNWQDGGFGLHGTPFQQTLLASREMIKKFRINHKLDVVNVVYLTDGDGNDGVAVPWSRGGVCYLVDRKTKKKIRVEYNVQSALTQLVRDVTGCKHLGFFLATKSDVARVCNDLELSNTMSAFEVLELKKQFREEKFVAIQNLGYDQYFYIQSANGAIAEDEMQIVSGMTKNKMANAFSKSVNSKKSNRALVTQFAEEISASLKWAA